MAWNSERTPVVGECPDGRHRLYGGGQPLDDSQPDRSREVYRFWRNYTENLPDGVALKLSDDTVRRFTETDLRRIERVENIRSHVIATARRELKPGDPVLDLLTGQEGEVVGTATVPREVLDLGEDELRSYFAEQAWNDQQAERYYEEGPKAAQAQQTARTVLEIWAALLPIRISDEILGDYLEDIARRAARGQRRLLFLRMFAAILWTTVNTIGYLLRELGRRKTT